MRLSQLRFFKLKPFAYLPSTIVFVVLGLLATTAFYTQQKYQIGLEAGLTSRKRTLIRTIGDLEKERNSLKRELKTLRQDITRYEKQAAADEGIFASFNRQLEDLRQAAGLTKVFGPGLEVVLGDSPEVPPGEVPENYIIHDYDLRLVVNSLWSGGAEAISINGQRLVATSPIRCAGNTVLVNSVRLASPYKILAIGNPDKLAAALEKNREVSRLIHKYAQTFSLQVGIEKKKRIEIADYAGSLKVKYAKPVEEGS